MTNKLIPLIDLDYPCWAVGNTVKETEPESHVLYNCRRWVQSVLDAFPDYPFYEAYIGGVDNFRYKVAVTKPYKGNRVQEKPFYFQQIREYFIHEWNAKVINGREADDALGERQYTAPKDTTTCIVSVDKDMLQIPGYHYNPRKKTFKKVSKTTADLFFFYQVIQGDRTDNIPGLYGYGKQKAAKIVKDNKHDVSQLKKVIVGLYKKEFGNKWASVLDEVSTLLFIHREPGKKYSDYFGGW